MMHVVHRQFCTSFLERHHGIIMQRWRKSFLSPHAQIMFYDALYAQTAGAGGRCGVDMAPYLQWWIGGAAGKPLRACGTPAV
jgi:hypothetical protein